MTGDFNDYRPTSGVVRRLRVSSSVVRLLALGLPLAAMTSVLAGSGRETVWAVPSSVSSGNQAWLNGLVGPAPTISPEEVPPPGVAVVPVGGDPQVLVLPGPGQPAGDTDGGHGAAADSGPDTGGLMSNGIPRRVLQAYVAAAQQTARIDPSCHIAWSLLAGIGRVESDHGRFGGSHVTAAGEITPPIYGPLLDGNGVGLVRDTDGGRLDGNGSLDRAVGPMQFIPGTWAAYGTDANGDGVADPQNVDDAALSAARYLCAAGGDLSTQNGRFQAVFRYNGSTSYVRLVLALADSYATGRAVPVEDEPAGSVPAAASNAETSATGGSPPAVNPDTSTATPASRTPTPTTTAPRPTSSSPSPSGTPTPTRTTTSPSPTTPSPTTPSPTSSSPTPSPTSSSPSPSSTTPSPTTSTPTPTTPSPTSSSPSPSSTTPSPTTSTPTPTTPSPDSSSSSSSSGSPTPSASTTPAASGSPSPSSADASPGSSSPSTTS